LKRIDNIFTDLEDFKFTEKKDEDNFKIMLTELHDKKPKDQIELLGNIDHLLILLEKAKNQELKDKIKDTIDESKIKKNEDLKKFFKTIFENPDRYLELAKAKKAELVKPSNGNPPAGASPEQNDDDDVDEETMPVAAVLDDTGKQGDMGALSTEQTASGAGNAPPTDNGSSEQSPSPETPAVEALEPGEPPNMGVLKTISGATLEKARNQVRVEVEELVKNMTLDKKFADAFIKIKNKLEKTEASSNLENLFTDCDILKNLLFELLENPDGEIENKKEAAKKALENVNKIIKTLEEEKA